MYLHLGRDIVVKKDEIVGIFDLDTSTISKITRNYLARSQKAGQIENVTDQLPKSFVVCTCRKSKKGQKVYISQISSTTLLKRWV